VRAVRRRQSWVGILCATGVAALSGAAGPARASSAPVVAGSGAAVPPLALALSAGHVGWVSARLSGPAGTQVQLTEDDRAGHGRLATVTLAPSGHTDLPRLLRDSCQRRLRRVTASADGSPVLTAQVITPACTTRLAVHVARTAQIAHGTTLTLSDRWRVGDLPVTVCLAPPAGHQSCETVRLASGQAVLRLALALPRVGGWHITAFVTGGRVHQATVWAGHPGPIRLLAAGDSEMQVLDSDLARDLAPDHVTVTSAAYPSSGLTVPDLFNWQQRARQLVARVRPDISIVSMGANEGYGITPPSGPPLQCCGLAWTAGYGQLVTKMARTLLQGQAATAFWFELAAPKPPQFARVLSAVNTGIRDAAQTLPGRLGLINANAYFTPGNRYRDYMTVDGQGFTIHEPDGIHLDATADAYAAKLVLRQLVAERVIR
jgi:hypothetical protein